VIINAGCGICTFSIHVCVHIFLTYSAWDDDHLLPGTQTYKLCEPPHALLVSYSFQCSNCILIDIYISKSKIRKFEREREREREWERQKPVVVRVELESLSICRPWFFKYSKVWAHQRALQIECWGAIICFCSRKSCLV
jgi:hypothetical protein